MLQSSYWKGAYRICSATLLHKTHWKSILVVTVVLECDHETLQSKNLGKHSMKDNFPADPFREKNSIHISLIASLEG